MELLNVLVVSLQGKSEFLIENSMKQANYNFSITHAKNKKDALAACGEQKFGILISNCKLPDGNVTDMVSVLGDLLPCMVMAEGKCPFTAESILFLPETNYYISCSEQISWITHLESTIAIWETAAKERLATFHNNSGSLYERALLRCAEELSPYASDSREINHSSVANALHILREVLDLSNVYICKKSVSDDGSTRISQMNVVGSQQMTPGTEEDFMYFKRWNTAFTDLKPISIVPDTVLAEEKTWWRKRNIQSFLAVPFSFKDSWDGFIGFEDELQPRKWSVAEISFLSSVADLIHEKHLLYQGIEKFQKDDA